MIRHTLFVLAFVVIFVLVMSAAQAQVYAEAGFSLHEQSWAEPEIRLSNPLGHVEIGYSIDTRILGARPSVFIRHQSSIPQYEDGYGLTEVGFEGRWEFFK